MIEELHLLNIPENLVKIAEFIIMNLEDNGYFRMELREVSEILEVQYKEVEKSLEIVQSLEPPGIGARNLQECLLIQTKKLYKDKNLQNIIQKYWDLLIKKKYSEIAQKMKINEKSVHLVIEKIKKLNPYPLINSQKKSLKKLFQKAK